MSGHFIISPNLPNGRVDKVVASSLDKSLLNFLRRLSIEILPTVPKNDLDYPVRDHSDMLLYHLGGNKFIVDKSQQEIIKRLKALSGDITVIDSVHSPYPYDCPLNCADIGDYIICNKNFACEKILSYGKTVIDVKQGYSKCSICIAGRNTLITDDPSVYSAVSRYSDITSLLIEKGSVTIPVYDYGFIGGCSGLIGKNHLLFNGDILLHKNGDEIKAFLKENNIRYTDIKNKPLTDMGSILPISESEGTV